MKRRITAILISMLMLVAMLPVASWAAESYPRCNTVAEAGTMIRKAMLKHDDTVSFNYRFTTSDYEKKLKSLDKKFFEEAVKHTGAPNEGEYLRWQYGGYTRHTGGTRSGDDYDVRLSYTIRYYTTAAEEAEITARVNSILASLHLDEKDDYNVIKSIYDYIIKNVTYDKKALEIGDMKAFTPYKAIIDSSHQAVCQGYSLLLYRMLLECGVDCRMVAADTGSSATEDGHAWNLIKLGDQYYICDPTWDSKLIHNGSACKYFLCGSKDFEDHEDYNRIYEYIADHPTAQTRYRVPSGTDAKPLVKAWRKTSIKSLKSGKKSLTVSWNKRPAIKGYQVQYGLKKAYDNGNAKIKTIENNDTGKTTISKLKSGKKYYVRVRTYKVVNGKKYYSKWSAKKTCTL